MNVITITGRLTRDPEVKYTQGGKAYAKLSVAVRQNFKNEKGEYGADFVNCVAWDKRAESIGEYFHKGSQIGINGRLSVRNYEDENKQKRTITEVIIEGFEFLDSKKKDGAAAESEGEKNDNPTDDDFPF